MTTNDDGTLVAIRYYQKPIACHIALRAADPAWRHDLGFRVKGTPDQCSLASGKLITCYHCTRALRQVKTRSLCVVSVATHF